MTQINLRWTNNSANQSAVFVERGINGVQFTQIASLAGDATAYPDTLLTPNTLYYYRVRAGNSCGNSAYSSIVNARTLATSPTPTVAPTPTATATPTPTPVSSPEAPSGLTATLLGCVCNPEIVVMSNLSG